MDVHEPVHGNRERPHCGATHRHRLLPARPSHHAAGEAPRVRAVVDVVLGPGLFDDALGSRVQRAERRETFRVGPRLGQALRSRRPDCRHEC